MNCLFKQVKLSNNLFAVNKVWESVLSFVVCVKFSTWLMNLWLGCPSNTVYNQVISFKSVVLALALLFYEGLEKKTWRALKWSPMPWLVQLYSPHNHTVLLLPDVRISIKFFVSLTKVYCIVLISTSLWNLTQFVTAWISVYSGIWWLSRNRVKLCLVSCNIPQKYRVSRVWKGVYQTRTLHHCSLKFYYTLSIGLCMKEATGKLLQVLTLSLCQWKWIHASVINTVPQTQPRPPKQSGFDSWFASQIKEHL